MKSSNFIDKYLAMAEDNFSNAAGYEQPYKINPQYFDLGVDGSHAGYYPSNRWGGANAAYSNLVEQNGNYYYADGGAPMQAAPDAGYTTAPNMAIVSAPRSVPVVPAKQASPYQINVSNTTSGNLTCILFGLNIYLLSTNYGTGVGVTVTPSMTNVSYLQLLQQSASQPFETSLIRIQTSSSSQLTQILNVVSTDANGQQCTIPIITQSYFSANQFQSTILDVPYPVKIDGNTYISFTILANTTATYTFFPAEKVNNTRILGGGSELQQYAPPAVPVAVPMFTSQPLIGSNQMMVPATVR